MVTIMAPMAVLLGWLLLFGLILTLAFVRSRRKPLTQRCLRAGARLTSGGEPVILPPIAKSRPRRRERGTQRGGVKAA